MVSVLAQHLYGFEGTTALFIFGAGVACMVAIAMFFVRLPLRVWLLAGLLFAPSLAPALMDDGMSYQPSLLLPLQMKRAELQLIFGVLLTVTVLLSGRVDLRSTTFQGFLMLAIAVYAGLISFIHEPPIQASETVLFAFATIPCVLIGFSDLVRTTEGCQKILRGLLMTGVAWAALASVQFVVNPRMLLNTSGRFLGLLANPQHAAVFAATIILIALYMLLNDRIKRLRVFWAVLLAIYLLFLGWTGSRTGVLMLAIGITPILYSRLKSVVLLLPLALVLVVILSYLAEALQIDSNLARLTSLHNTRASTIPVLLDSIMSSPLVGVGIHEAGASENSYLLGFASYGVGMFLLILLFLFVSMSTCLRLWANARELSVEGRSLAFLLIGINASYFLGAAAEGYMVGRAFPTQVTMLVVCVMAGGVLHQMAFREQPQVHEEEDATVHPYQWPEPY